MKNAISDGLWGGGSIAIITSLVANDALILIISFLTTITCFAGLWVLGERSNEKR